MNAWKRTGTLAGILCMAVGVTGCSLGSLAYFLTPEQKLPPELCSLVSPDHKQQTRVIVLTSLVDPVPKQGCGGLDRDLSERVARQLHELCMTNKENVLIVAPRKVQDFKSKHSDWQTMHPAEIGASKEFKADYVINLQINSVSLMDRDSFAELYRGRIDMDIALVDVHHPDYTPERRDFSDIFPDEARPMTRDTMRLSQFRSSFLDRIAKRIACYFESHPREPHQQDPNASMAID